MPFRVLQAVARYLSQCCFDKAAAAPKADPNDSRGVLVLRAQLFF
jgi:hypothetical protein